MHAQVILTDGASEADVAFYFVHWLTDLAGAVPNPLHGSEKFVTQFPHFVLDSFITSFPLIHRLAHMSETDVFEEYLHQRWEELRADLGELPTGDDTIALARLVVQAQSLREQLSVAAAYRSQLSTADRATLAMEMALTGIEGQRYKSVLSDFGSHSPAFLVYYSPAFLRTVSKSNPLAALQILAVIYRSARELFPFALPKPTTSSPSGTHGGATGSGSGGGSSFTSGGSNDTTTPPVIARRGSRELNSSFVPLTSGTVTVRIDQIKDMDTEKLLEAHAAGDKWYIARCNPLEAVVVRHNPTTQLVLPAELDESAHNFREMAVVDAFLPVPLVPLNSSTMVV